MAALTLTVLGLGGPLLEQEKVAWVRLRLADEGLLTIYPRHAPLLAQTLAGELAYEIQTAARVESLPLPAGLVSIRNDRVVVLTGNHHGTATGRE